MARWTWTGCSPRSPWSRSSPAGYEVGVQEKGISALESLLFAKYQMYRNVYWHHAVRSATCMFKRAVRGAVRRGIVTAQDIAEATDDGLMETLIGRDRNELAAAIRARHLHKRALDLPASDVPAGLQPWVAEDPDLLELVEDAVADAGRAAAGRAAARLPGSLVDAGGRPAAPHPGRYDRAAHRCGPGRTAGAPSRGGRIVPERPPSSYLCCERTKPIAGARTRSADLTG